MNEFEQEEFPEKQALPKPVEMGAGKYVLTVCTVDGHPELVVHHATEEEKARRTVGDLEEPRPIDIRDIVLRLRFVSELGLFSLEQQLRLIREAYFGD